MDKNTTSLFFLRVTAVDHPPYTTLDYDDNGNIQVHGAFNELQKELANRLKFNYIIQPNVKGGYGTVLPNGTGTGMVGMLWRKEADLILSPMSLSYERLQAVEYMPIIADQVMTILSSSLDTNDIVDFTDAIVKVKWEIWTCLLASIATSCVCYYVDDALERYKRRNLKTHYSYNTFHEKDSYLWGFFRIFFNQGSSYFLSKSSNPVKRNLLMCFTLCTFFFNAYFSGHLSTEAVVDTTRNVDSIEDLLNERKGCPLFEKDTLPEYIIFSSEGAMYDRLRERMRSCAVSSIPIEKLEDDTTFQMILSNRFGIVTSEKTMVLLGRKLCNKHPKAKLHIARYPLFVFLSSITVRKDIDLNLRKSVTKIMQRIISSGLMLKWMSEKGGLLPTCFHPTRIEYKPELTLGDLTSLERLFYAWMIGAGASVATVLIEILVHSIRGRKKRVVDMISSLEQASVTN